MAIIKKNWFLIALIYTLVNFLILVNQGIYWDDWLIYNTGKADIYNQFIGNGLWYMAPIHLFLQNITKSPAFLYHLIIFFLDLFPPYFFTEFFHGLN